MERWCASKKPCRAPRSILSGGLCPGRQGFPTGGLRPALTTLAGSAPVDGLAAEAGEVSASVTCSSGYDKFRDHFVTICDHESPLVRGVPPLTRTFAVGLAGFEPATS